MKKMLFPQDWTSVKDELPAKSGCYYAVANDDIYEISTVTENNIAFFLKDPEKYNKKLFKGIHDSRWYHKDNSGHLIDVTGIITHWICA